MNTDNTWTCDVLVIGSGAGGLATAVTAAAQGLDVIVVEKEQVFGGTTAWSGGWMWIPCNPLALRAGIAEPAGMSRRYLQDELGERFDAAKVDAFLEHGPRMVDFFEQRTALKFIDGNAVPDFHDSSTASATGGRSVSAAPYDGRELGELIHRLRPPLREITLCGLAIAAGQDMRHFFNATRSLRSAVHVARRLAVFACERLLHGRSMRLVNGNALVARLLKSASDLGVRLFTEARAVRLMQDGDRASGARVLMEGRTVEVHAARGVVLACGGFPHDIERRRALFPHTPTGAEHWSAAPAANTGDGIRLGEAAGAAFDATAVSPAAWAPVSLVPYPDGTSGTFPHFVDRAKPGVIAVTCSGKRFVNEACSYHDFIAALIAATPEGEAPRAWLICDHRFQRRYGLGYAKPFPFPLGPYIRSGYLMSAADIASLAAQCGIDAAALQQTLDTYNRDARTGCDTAFHKGSTAYNRAGGDPAHQPNPCVAPIEDGPFHAVRILPGSLGTFAGLKSDAQARALDRDGRAIPGLFVVGNDAASMMGGHYPSGGITLGPMMTFGYLAGLHLANVDPQTTQTTVLEKETT